MYSSKWPSTVRIDATLTTGPSFQSRPSAWAMVARAVSESRAPPAQKSRVMNFMKLLPRWVDRFVGVGPSARGAEYRRASGVRHRTLVPRHLQTASLVIAPPGWYKTRFGGNLLDSQATEISQGKRMSRVCEITGKKPAVGNRVSHANNKTRRRFLPNLHTQRFWVETEKRWVTLRLSTSGMRTVA